jgi:hypothetical protein
VATASGGGIDCSLGILGWDGLKGAFIVKGWACFHGKYVHHVDGGLPNGPEPVVPGEAVFCKECLGYFHGRVPVVLYCPILGLPMWRGCTINWDAVRPKELANRAGKEAPIKVATKLLREATGVN